MSPADSSAPTEDAFTPVQKEYLAGFGAGLAAAQALPSAAASAPAAAEQTWFGTPLDEITREERLKIERDPFTLWDQMVRAAATDTPPADGDVFRYKYHGLFWVAPAQDSFMVRVRVPGNVLSAQQARALAQMSEDLANGWLDVTTRGNVQIRTIAPRHAVEVLKRLSECGLSSRGAGADNVRNVTASPLAGLDPSELLDTRGLARDMQFYLNYHPEVFGLPRKFNIAFDGGGRISNVADTNDIAFIATHRRDPAASCEVLMRIQLAGITGHERFAVSTQRVVAPEHAVEVAGAMLQVFAAHGDRTSRNTARLCYLLDRIGLEAFLQLTEERLGWTLTRVEDAELAPRPATVRRAHLGLHPQTDAKRYYAGLILTAGRLSSAQMRCLAEAAERFGSQQLRLTVWQNILVPDLAYEHLEAFTAHLAQAGLSCDAAAVAGSIVACTGNTGCRFAEADTKGHARQIAAALGQDYRLADAVNIHLTGCPHSCAQHFIGDIGFLGAQMGATADGARIEGYHMFIGGGADEQQSLARELARNVPASHLPHAVRALLDHYQGTMLPGETFHAYALRHPLDLLRSVAGLPLESA